MLPSTRTQSLIRWAVASVLSTLAFSECGNSFEAGNPSNVADASMPDDSADGESIIVVVPPTPTDDSGHACDTSAEPKDEPCLVDDAFGVFVSSTTGTASGAGTKASPLDSIDAAITLAVPEGGATPKRVYVCAGTYDEKIAIGVARDDVKVFGGFTCANSTWTYTGALATIAPSTQGVPLTLTGLTSALFADLEIDAQSAPQAPPPPDAASASGASSIAVVANGATGVEFRRTKIVAGNGQPGADGILTPYTMLPTAAGLHGSAASGVTGGQGGGFACPGGGGTRGGNGGDAPGGSGNPGIPALAQGSGTAAQCASGTGGSDGANALAAGPGAGAQTPGTLLDATWQPAGGTNGARGGAGQGGGGGGAGNSGGGGGGGGGGCGGVGGGAGGGGGASAALLTVMSKVTLTSATLVSATGGNGGAGVPGQPGQALFGAGGDPSASGCSGGHGGTGGAGGAGGGGAGGVSACVLYKGSTPTLDNATSMKFTQGHSGTKGTGGAPGINDGFVPPTGMQVQVQ